MSGIELPTLETECHHLAIALGDILLSGLQN